MIAAVIESPLTDLLVSGVGGVALACLLLALVRWRSPWWLMLACGLIPLAIICCLNPTYRIFSYHGLYHASIVYQLMNGQIPPSDPLMGGVPLAYPWAAHVAIAWIARLTSLSPAWIFAIVNAGSLMAALAAMYRVASFLCEDRQARILAAALPIFGMTFVARGALDAFLVPVSMHYAVRGEIPIACKFSNINTMPIGIALFAVFVGLMLKTFGDDTRTWRTPLAVFFTVFACGVLYPFAWVAMIGAAVGASLAMLSIHRAAGVKRILSLALAGFLGSLCSAPLSVFLMAAKAEGAGFSLTPSPADMFHKAAFLALALLPGVVLAGCSWQRLGELFRREVRLVLIVASGAALLLANVFVHAPDSVEYKWRGLGLMLMGVPVGICAADLWRRRPGIAAIVVALLLSPLAHDCLAKIGEGRAISDPLREEGAFLHSTQPANDRLCSWIATQTPVDAIVVDSTLDMPVLGRRALYAPLEEGSVPGWLYPPPMFLRVVHGHPAPLIAQRMATAREVLSTETPRISDGAIEALAGVGRPVYVVTRKRELARRIELDTRFQEEFAQANIRVFRLIGSGQPE